MADFIMKAGDTSPALAVTLTDESGNPVDLTGTDVRFLMESRETDTLVVDTAATITEAGDGAVEYAWEPADTESPGLYHAEFEVTYSDDTVETFPNDSYLRIRLVEGLD